MVLIIMMNTLVTAQLESFKNDILKYKDHPALLMWAVGNEVDLFYKILEFGKQLEKLQNDKRDRSESSYYDCNSWY